MGSERRGQTTYIEFLKRKYSELNYILLLVKSPTKKTKKNVFTIPRLYSLAKFLVTIVFIVGSKYLYSAK